MKREVEYMVDTLVSVLKPMIEGGSADCSNLDLTGELGFFIERVIYNEETQNLIIITPDRPEKSAVIGKGGWVVGRLREELGVNSIHVDAYSDMIIRIYRMELALKQLEKIVTSIDKSKGIPLKNLQDLLRLRINNLGGFNFLKDLEADLTQLITQKTLRNKKLEELNEKSPDHICDCCTFWWC